MINKSNLGIESVIEVEYNRAIRVPTVIDIINLCNEVLYYIIL